MSDIVAAIHAQQSYLLRVARLQLRERDQAERVVQETLQDALAAQDRFSGKTSVKTWLTGILAPRIIAALRKQSREPAAPTLTEETGIDDLDAFFDGNDRDHWNTKLAEWRNPERDMEQKQFMSALDACLEKLPPNTARAYMLREVMRLDSAEICDGLKITATELWVMLYRARMSLRSCLEQNWFARTESTG